MMQTSYMDVRARARVCQGSPLQQRRTSKICFVSLFSSAEASRRRRGSTSSPMGLGHRQGLASRTQLEPLMLYKQGMNDKYKLCAASEVSVWHSELSVL